jgi:cellulose 1,4-beta-cellobiosidase
VELSPARAAKSPQLGPLARTGLSTPATYIYLERMTATRPRHRLVSVLLAASAAVAFVGIGSSYATAAADTTPPSRPGAPTAVSVSPTMVTLTWTPSTDDVGVVQYRVDTLSINSIRTVYSTTNTATFTDLWPGGWVFAVAAFDAAGNQSQWSPPSSGISLPMPTDTIPPTVPTQVVASNITETGARLSWQPSTDNIGVTGYDVWQFTQRTGFFGKIGSSATTSFQVSGLVRASNYTFYVQARDADGNGSDLLAASVAVRTAGAVDTSPPTAPGTPTVLNVTSTSVTLTWAASTDNIGVTSYLAFSPATPTRPGVSRSSTTTSVTVPDLLPNTQYAFSVSASDAAGNVSPPSGTVTFTTPPVGGPGFACRVRYTTNTWSSGFTARVRITNTGTSGWTGWRLTFTFPGTQQIRENWGATWSQQGANVVATNLPNNGNLVPNHTLEIGFNGTYTGSNTRPGTFAINGVNCSVG